MALVAITGKCGKGFEELESALGEFARRNPEMTDDEAVTIQVQPGRDPLGGAIDPDGTGNTQTNGGSQDRDDVPDHDHHWTGREGHKDHTRSSGCGCLTLLAAEFVVFGPAAWFPLPLAIVAYVLLGVVAVLGGPGGGSYRRWGGPRLRRSLLHRRHRFRSHEDGMNRGFSRRRASDGSPG